MSEHPSIDALQAHLDVPDPELDRHFAECAACRDRASRLAGGVALIDEVRRLTPVPPPWERMDEVLAKEAEAVSRDIRAGRLRPAPRVSSWVAAGFAVAASAGLVVGARSWMKSHEGPAVAPIAQRVVTPPVVEAVLPAYEGVVLLSAGGARYRDGASTEGAVLARTTSLHEGGGIETGATARAVFTVQSGWTADVRSGSSVRLSQLRTTKTTVTLDHGELALAPTAGEADAVQVLHGGWSVEAHGPVVARTDSTMLRVVVLAGRTDVRRGDGEALSVTGPLVVELPLDGSAPRQVTAGVADARSIELAVLGAQGNWYDIPSIDPTATLTLMGHGALPSALEAVRLMGPGTIQARIGRTEMRLVLDGNGTPQWAVFHAPTGPVVALNRPPAPPQSAEAAPAEVGDGLTPLQVRQISASIAGRFQHCIATCVDRNQCPESLSVAATVTFSPGEPAVISSLDRRLANARGCLDNEARHLPIRLRAAHRFPVTFNTGTR